MMTATVTAMDIETIDAETTLTRKDVPITQTLKDDGMHRELMAVVDVVRVSTTVHLEVIDATDHDDVQIEAYFASIGRTFRTIYFEVDATTIPVLANIHFDTRGSFVDTMTADPKSGRLVISSGYSQALHGISQKKPTNARRAGHMSIRPALLNSIPRAG